MMGATQYTHVTISVDDVDESVEFYMDVFDMDEIPAVNFDAPVRWMDNGGLQLHLLGTQVGAPAYHHFGVHVEDFEAFYTAAMANEGATFEALTEQTGAEFVDGEPPVLYLPTGTVQAYVRDPSGNLIEVNYPNVEDLDESVVKNIVERPDVSPGTPEGADIYGRYGLDPE